MDFTGDSGPNAQLALDAVDCVRRVGGLGDALLYPTEDVNPVFAGVVGGTRVEEDLPEPVMAPASGGGLLYSLSTAKTFSNPSKPITRSKILPT